MTEPSKATDGTQPDVIEDLDVTGDDADAVAGGDLKLEGVKGESQNNTRPIEIG